MTLEKTSDGWRVRLRYGSGLRGRFAMPDMPEAEAKARRKRLQAMATMLAESGKHAEAQVLLTEAASKTTDKQFAGVERAARDLCSRPDVPAPKRAAVLFRDVGFDWLSGKLRDKHEDDVGKLEAGTRDRYRSILAVVNEVPVRGGVPFGSLPVAEITLDDAEAAKAAVPPDRGQGTRRHYALVIRRVISLSVYPLKLRESNPIPAQFVPPQGKAPVFAFLYPDEEAQLLRHLAQGSAEDREDGLAYGVLHREGLRASELLGLTWGDVDLVRGVVVLDENKTDDPRSWALGPDVVRALSAYRGNASGGDVIFSLFVERHQAERFRAHIVAAEITRKELFERSGSRRPIRLHETRGSFISVALATGKTETWVMDRTGHRSSQMVNHYRRAARRLAEIGVAWFEELDVCLDLGGPRVGLQSQPQGKTPYPPSTGSRSPGSPETHQQPNSARSETEVGPETTAGPPKTPRVGQGGPGPDAPTDPITAALVRIEESLSEDLKALIAAGRYDLADKVMSELRDRRLQRTAPAVSSLSDARRKRDEGGK